MELRPLSEDATTARRLGRGEAFQLGPRELDVINAALYLRRPLLVTGKPGVGKSSLAYAVAAELGLGPVLRWSVTSSTTLEQGLYRYDAIGRFQASRPGEASPDIGRYLRLGPMGTALLPADRPRVLLIDEIDKSDVDFPNDLLHVFEEGEFEIPELARMAEEREVVRMRADDGVDLVPIRHGRVQCNAFPFVLMTSNGEREFPPAFLRRCLRLSVQEPDAETLVRIVEAHLSFGDGGDERSQVAQLVADYLVRREKGNLLSIDQLLNAVFLTLVGVDATASDHEELREVLLRHLNVADTA